MAHYSTRPKTTAGVLFSMCLALVLVVASVSAINLGLPDLAVQLGASNTDLTWIADAYTVALAALVLPMGALGDRWGRRTILLGGVAVFAVASLCAALAPTIGSLIAFRIVMGIGAAMIMPGTLSTITAVFPPSQRARGVAVWAGFAGAGAIIGMFVSGGLLEEWSWRSIFYVSAATAVVSGLAALLLAPNTLNKNPPKFDTFGSCLSVVGIGTLVFAIIEGNDQGWLQPLTIGAITLSAASFATYVFHGLRTADPLLDPRLFVLPGFRVGTLTIVVQFAALFALFFMGLQYLQLLLGYSPLRSALALLPVAIVVLIVSTATPYLLRFVRLDVTMGVGLVLLATGMALIGLLRVDSGYQPFLVGLAVSGLGVAVTSATSTASIVASLPTRQQGVASAVNDATREIGASVGIALSGALFSSHYGSSLSDLSYLTPDTASRVRESAPAGFSVGHQLGAEGTKVLSEVKTAFVEGLAASMFPIAIMLAIAAAFVVIQAPRKLPETDDDEVDTELRDLVGVDEKI